MNENEKKKELENETVAESAATDDTVMPTASEGDLPHSMIEEADGRDASEETQKETVEAVAEVAASEAASGDSHATAPQSVFVQSSDVHSQGNAAGMPPVGIPSFGAQMQPPPATAYKWTYAEQRNHDAATDKKRRSNGVLIYALVMTGVFALSFGLLLGTLFMKGGDFPTIQFGEPVTDENGEIISANDYADAVNIEKAKHSVVLIEVTTPNGGGSGTGIILSEDGYIATNHHVIEDGTAIRVKFYDGTYANATLRGSSAVDDLAVIKVERSGLIPATFAKSSDCFVGQTVYAIGNPSGAEMAWTTTKGCISYVDRELKIYKDDGTLEKKLKMIQTDAMVNPGNSGGPLVNAHGQVVGIVSMKLADGYEGIGFAIPSDGAAEILNAIIKDGNADNVNSNVSYERPVIGITGVYMEGGKHYVFEENRIVEVSESYAKENPDEVITPAVSGIYVRSLTEGTDAAIKLLPGDIITAINGVEATNMNVLMNEINDHYAGDDVTVTYYRNSLYTDVTITLSAAKE